MQSLRSTRAVLLCLVAAGAAPGADDKLASLTKAVTAFKLANGAQFFVVERPYSPFVAFHLRMRAGVADEPSGRGGLSAMALLNFLEGSESYGTRGLAAEKAALAEAERLLDVSRTEASKGEQADEVPAGAKRGGDGYHTGVFYERDRGFFLSGEEQIGFVVWGRAGCVDPGDAASSARITAYASRDTGGSTS